MEACRHLSNIAIAILLSSSWSTIHAQHSWRDIETVNLFEYGKPVTDEQVNFDNFLINFPLCVQNADEIDIIEINYVGKIQDNQQARMLVSHNIHHSAPAWGMLSSYGTSSNELEEQDNYFRLTTQTRIDTARENIPEIINTLIDHYIHIGDTVYSIKLVSPELQTFEYYVFVNSKTKQVITKGNMLAFEIPVDFVKEKTKGSN